MEKVGQRSPHGLLSAKIRLLLTMPRRMLTRERAIPNALNQSDREMTSVRNK